MPPAIVRNYANLGRSNFVGGDDTYWSGEIDNFRVYNQALNQAQVTALAGTALYGDATATTGTRTCPQAANTATTVPPLSVFYSAAFNTDPRSFAGGASAANYGWLQYDTNDTTPVQQAHDGLVLLGYGRGASNPGRYVNFSATSSAMSIGQPLGQFGGFGTGSYNAGTAGWSFELEFRALETQTSTATVNGQTWAKVFDLGNGNTNGGGSCYNDILFGFGGDSRTMTFQTCHVQGNQQTLGGTTPVFINWGSWYHVLVSLQLVPGGSLGSLWVNGTLNDQRILPYFPLFAPRNNAQLGKSSWNDAYFNGEIDMFNIYSQAFNQAQASALYAASLLPATPVSSSSAGAAVSSSSASSSGSVVAPFLTSASSSSTGVAARSSVSSSSGSVSSSSVPVVAASGSSSSSSATPSTVDPSSSSAQNPFVVATASSSSVIGATSAGLPLASSSSAGTLPGGGNAASFTGPSVMILAVIATLASLLL